MGKTYSKAVRFGNTGASNTDFYKTKRKNYRKKAKQNLHSNMEDFVNPEDLTAFKDNWREPSDGSFTVRKTNISEVDRKSQKIAKYKLKAKHEKNS